MSILILGFPLDVHLHAVRWALKEMSIPCSFLYASDLPATARASVTIENGRKSEGMFRHPQGEIDLSKIDTVWFRRTGLPMKPASMHEADWTISERECEYFLKSFRYLLADKKCFWVNGIEARERALVKSIQLQVADAVGFAIPETLITNDPTAARNFYARFKDEGVIFKLAYQARWTDATSTSGHALFTTEIFDQHLQTDQSISFCPAFFQRKMQKAFEVRVTCIGSVCYAARLDSQTKRATSLDWRADFANPLTPVAMTLPETVADKCIELMEKLGLKFGCIDFVVTPENEYVFLEINEMGQFLWVEKGEPKLNLLSAFITLLVEKKLESGDKLIGLDRINWQSFVDSADYGLMNEQDVNLHQPYAPRGLAVETTTTTTITA